MRIARILTLIVAVGVALVAAALLAVWLLVNPNDFKPRIAAAVKASTGRELVLSGDLKLSVFPWIALELGPGSLGNPPGFAAEPFLSFNHAAVRVRLERRGLPPIKLLPLQLGVTLAAGFHACPAR